VKRNPGWLRRASGQVVDPRLAPLRVPPRSAGPARVPLRSRARRDDPPAVLRHEVTVRADSSDRAAGWALAHVGQEVPESHVLAASSTRVVPPPADPNSAAAVEPVARKARVAAPTDDLRPRDVRRRAEPRRVESGRAVAVQRLLVAQVGRQLRPARHGDRAVSGAYLPSVFDG